MPLTPEWIEKAEGDFHSALRELRARKNPNYSSACFHAQQCVEKYLKGRLQEEVCYDRDLRGRSALRSLSSPRPEGLRGLRS
jgi:HEPN domain-containing protein